MEYLEARIRPDLCHFVVRMKEPPAWYDLPEFQKIPGTCLKMNDQLIKRSGAMSKTHFGPSALLISILPANSFPSCRLRSEQQLRFRRRTACFFPAEGSGSGSSGNRHHRIFTSDTGYFKYQSGISDCCQ